jgi:hypothetical protein
MWVDPADDPRDAIDAQPVGEKATVWDYLRRYRLTIETKCADLTPDQLAQRSTMSLLGLVRHLARVEHHWFRRVLQRQDVPRIYRTDEDPISTSTARRLIRRSWPTHGTRGVARSPKPTGGSPSATTSALCCRTPAARSPYATCWCTRWRSTRGTPGTPTCYASASTAEPGSDRGVASSAPLGRHRLRRMI